MAKNHLSPLPPLPPTITIPTFKVTSTPSGDISIPSTLPFYYAAIQTVWIYWQVDLPVLEPYLTPLGMTPASFDGVGAVGINFFNAAALYGQGQPGNPGVGGFNETELTILAFPSNQAANIPEMTLHDFVTQGDQTKRIGAYRVWVACDSAVAVAAGQQLFFENKFLTPYTYNVPSLNNPGQALFTWTCHDPADAAQSIYTAQVSLSGLNPVPGNMSEWIDLSYVKSAKRVAGSRRNYLGMSDTYFIPPANHNAVSVSMGQSTHPMRGDMQTLIGTRPAAVVQIFQSPTCIAEAQPYWADLSAETLMSGPRRIPRAPSEETRQRFVAFSVLLTGYDSAELWGTGMVNPYLCFLIDAVGDEVTGALLSKWAMVADAAGKDHAALEQLVRDEILADAALGPVTRNLIVMWYLGEWQQLPADWRDVHGTHAADQTCFVSPDAYAQGLVWNAIGAHPQGAKMPGYGSWALPPTIPEELP